MPIIVNETDFGKVSRAYPDAAKIVAIPEGFAVFTYHTEYLAWKGRQHG